jgi:hypothetical protein
MSRTSVLSLALVVGSLSLWSLAAEVPPGTTGLDTYQQATTCDPRYDKCS